MIRRRPLLLTIALLLLLLLGALAWLTARFDAEGRRAALQQELSAALGQPVRLGEVSFSLRHGPALALDDIRIDAEDSGFSLQQGRLYLRLQWRPLLRGELVFSRVLLENPHLRVRLSPAREGSPVGSPLPAILASASIASLEIENGHLLLEDRRDPERPMQLEMTDLHAGLTGIAWGETAWLRLSALLKAGESASPLLLAGELTLPPDSSQPEKARVHLGAIFETFSPSSFLAAVPGLPPVPLQGTGRLEATLSGGPKQGLKIDLRLTGPGLALHSAGAAEPLPFAILAGSGLWTPSADGGSFRGLSIRLDDLTLQGEAAWTKREETPWLEARLESSPVPAEAIRKLLPSAMAHQGDKISGLFQLSSLEFAGPAERLTDLGGFLSAARGRLSWTEGSAILPHIGPAEGISTVLHLRDGGLSWEGDAASLLGAPVRFRGAIDDLAAPAATFSAEVQAALPAERLLQFLPEQNRRAFFAEGEMPARLALRGTEDGRLRFDLSADLLALATRWEPALVKKPGTAGELALSGEVAPAAINLEAGRLSLPLLELRTSGFCSLDPAGDYRLDIDLSLPSLQKAQALLPPLQKIQAHGALALRAELSRTGNRQKREGTLRLRNAGLRVPVVAPFSAINGTIRLTEKGAWTEGLTARLGPSFVRLNAVLEDFSDPRLELRVWSEALRADTTIFHSPTSILRDLDGRIVITRDRVAFSPVRVRLDGGTVAEVTGQVTDFHAPHVELDIQAPYGDIDEVIGLWISPEEKPAAPSAPGTEPGVTVWIRAQAQQGKIGPLRFEQAEGIIRWEKGVLAIHPLHFRAAGGTCTGGVTAEKTPEGFLLGVSGHAERMEAAVLYRELLHGQRLVSGRLRSDFFVEGLIGKDYRSTVRGGASLEVERGVLYRFSALSKVFSLLNVSQVLSLRLPDMARDGMPFSRLRATGALDKGVLRTEDLFIDSHAMNLSLVGTVDIGAEKIDALLGVKPLGTVDKVVTQIPLAGWILAGEEKALITAHFQIRGPLAEPDVAAVPITSVSEKAIGIFRRLFGLPGRMVGNLEDLLRSGEP